MAENANNFKENIINIFSFHNNSSIYIIKLLNELINIYDNENKGKDKDN